MVISSGCTPYVASGGLNRPLQRVDVGDVGGEKVKGTARGITRFGSEVEIGRRENKVRPSSAQLIFSLSAGSACLNLLPGVVS